MSQESENVDEFDQVDVCTDDLRDLLRLQMDECEMLQSMYPNPQELSLDYGALVDIGDYVSGRTEQKPKQLNYTIRLEVSGFELEVIVSLPSEYPSARPEVFVRSQLLDRLQQRTLNRDVANVIAESERGEILIGTVIAWLQEHAIEYFNSDLTSEPVEGDVVARSEEEDICSRLWIYSHHIYSTVKRKLIQGLAQEYKLTGFCLPGKPGIVCIEGHKSDCDDWWQQVKGLTWKKIRCLRQEEDKVENLSDWRKFPDFQEISFNSNKTRKQDHHMDFGEFNRYLKENQCDYMFKEFFGMEGK